MNNQTAKILNIEDCRGIWHGIVGEHPMIKNVIKLGKKAALSDEKVVITGRSGTGKELLAKMIHKLSSRKDEIFLTINCSAFNEQLLESELFGHEKGSFTGATKMKKGVFELADRGTVFLDEAGDMSAKMQTKLLRLLDTMRFQRVGGEKEIVIDVRIIAATNKNLKSMVVESCFREDLYYRLNVINIHLPSLSERENDIVLIADYVLEKYIKKLNTKITFSDDAYHALLKHKWPGNVRELKNVVARAVTFRNSNTLTPVDLNLAEEFTLSNRVNFLKVAMSEATKAFQQDIIIQRIAHFGGNVANAAESLGIQPTHLYSKLKKYGLSAVDFR